MPTISKLAQTAQKTHQVRFRRAGWEAGAFIEPEWNNDDRYRPEAMLGVSTIWVDENRAPYRFTVDALAAADWSFLPRKTYIFHDSIWMTETSGKAMARICADGTVRSLYVQNGEVITLEGKDDNLNKMERSQITVEDIRAAWAKWEEMFG